MSSKPYPNATNLPTTYAGTISSSNTFTFPAPKIKESIVCPVHGLIGEEFENAIYTLSTKELPGSLIFRLKGDIDHEYCLKCLIELLDIKLPKVQRIPKHDG